MDLIKDRLAHIIRAKNLTATQFAELMQIQPSNVSHLLNGRNKPSLDFLTKLKEVFPEYNFDWIIMGKKPITINDPSPILSEKQMFDFSDDTESKVNITLDDVNSNFNEVIDKQHDNTSNNLDKIVIPKSLKDPKDIIFIYDDNSFEIFHVRS